jgi:hypothetical protein
MYGRAAAGVLWLTGTFLPAMAIGLECQAFSSALAGSRDALPDATLEVVMNSENQSYEAAVAKNGSPAQESSFRIGDIDSEFRVELFNFYPNDHGQNADVEIREATWPRGQKNLTIWFHKVGDEWVGLHSLTWDKDAEF